MTSPHSNIPASRGRIIKRSSNLGGSAPVSPEPQKESHSIIKPGSSEAGRPEKKRSLTLAIALSLVFAASAVVMWNRPINETASAVQDERISLSSRYTDLGSQIADRFATKVSGRIITPPKKQDSVVTAPSTAPVAPKEKGQPSNAAVENQVYKILKRHGKPTQNGKVLAAAIVKESMLQGYDPVFVAAVIKSESAFNALARSHKGAQGLMQIMPRTGAWLADQQAIPRGKLTDPGHNLKLGISYLKQLEQEYGGNRVLTLIAYNWGPGHVEKASSGSRRVPGEVMQYAVKILNDYRRWTSELHSTVG